MKRKWKHFTKWQLRQALSWVDSGGIAVHDISGKPVRGSMKISHLLVGGMNMLELKRVMEELGLKLDWLQRTSVPAHIHFDIFGEPRRRALQKCKET